MGSPHFIFSSDKLELKSEGEDFFVEGYISTSDLDLVNDIVTKACLMDMANQMKERVIKFDVEHESFRGKSKLEREVNKTTIPVAKVDDFLMDKKGIKVRAKLNRHATRFSEVMGSIKDGFLDAFSIAYIPVKATIQNKDGKEIRLLDKLNLLNVAFTGNPVNTESRMTNIFAKSLEFLDEQEKAKAPKRPKPKIPESEYEDDDDEDEDEDKKKKKKKKEQKNHNHKSDIIKLQEAKMSEEDEKKPEEVEGEESESQEEATEQKDEFEEESDDESDAEVKALREEVKSLKEDFAELKAKIKAPVRKSPMEQKDKSEQFEEGKSLNPLDVIA